MCAHRSVVGTHGWVCKGAVGCTPECVHTGGYYTLRTQARVRGAAAPGPPPPPHGSQLQASRRLPRAAPPRLRFVPRGTARCSWPPPTPAAGRPERAGLRWPRWSRHRGRGGSAHRGQRGRGEERASLVCFGFANDSFMAAVVLLKYSESPPAHTRSTSIPPAAVLLRPHAGPNPAGEGADLKPRCFSAGDSFLHRTPAQGN